MATADECRKAAAGRGLRGFICSSVSLVETGMSLGAEKDRCRKWSRGNLRGPTRSVEHGTWFMDETF